MTGKRVARLDSYRSTPTQPLTCEQLAQVAAPVQTFLFFLFRVSLAGTRFFCLLFKSLHFLQKALGMGDDDGSPKCTWQLSVRTPPQLFHTPHKQGVTTVGGGGGVFFFLTVLGLPPQLWMQEAAQISLKSTADIHTYYIHILTICTKSESIGEREQIVWRDEHGLQGGAPSSLQASSILWPQATLPLHQPSPHFLNCIRRAMHARVHARHEATVLVLRSKTKQNRTPRDAHLRKATRSST